MPGTESPATRRPSAAGSAKPTPGPSGHGLVNGNPNHLSSSKILGRHSSKPILHWLQRKLGASSKPKKSLAGGSSGSAPPVRPTSSLSSAATRGGSANQQPRFSQLNAPTTNRGNTVSLNDDDENRTSGSDGSGSDDGSSLARESTWAPTHASADEDASMRPLPPSSPPSPSPSRDSSSYLSDPKTFKSIAASTKPTTVLSIDLNVGGMAHIAQAPANIGPALLNSPHSRSGSNATNGPSTSNFLNLPPSSPASVSGHTNAELIQAPQHTAHHPRNNPRPSSPPLDNASMFTLASSAYAIPGLRQNIVTNGLSGPPSAVGDSVSFSHAGSMYADAESSHFPMGEDDRDVDASVRALRPRSSRRGSWESEISRWSARPGGGTPVSKRMLWTTGSVKTGEGRTFDDDDDENASRTSLEDTVEDAGADDKTDGPESPRKDVAPNDGPLKDSSLTPVEEQDLDEQRRTDLAVTVAPATPEQTRVENPVDGIALNGSTESHGDTRDSDERTEPSTPSPPANPNLPSPLPPPSTLLAPAESEKESEAHQQPAAVVAPTEPTVSGKGSPPSHIASTVFTAPPQVENHGQPSPCATEVSEGGELWHSAPSTPGPAQSPAILP